MIDDKLVEKFQDYNIFIGDVIRTPKVKKVSKGEQQYIFLNLDLFQQDRSLLLLQEHLVSIPESTRLEYHHQKTQLSRQN